MGEGRGGASGGRKERMRACVYFYRTCFFTRQPVMGREALLVQGWEKDR